MTTQEKTPQGVSSGAKLEDWVDRLHRGGAHRRRYAGRHLHHGVFELVRELAGVEPSLLTDASTLRDFCRIDSLANVGERLRDCGVEPDAAALDMPLWQLYQLIHVDWSRIQ